MGISYVNISYGRGDGEATWRTADPLYSGSNPDPGLNESPDKRI